MIKNVKKVIKVVDGFANYRYSNSVGYQIVSEEKHTPEELATKLINDLEKEGTTKVLQIISYGRNIYDYDKRYSSSIEMTLLVEEQHEV